MTRKIPAPLSATEAERSVMHYARSWPIYSVSGPTVVEAVLGVGRLQMSYWDALIWATAKLSGIPNVLSEDFNDGALLEGIRFLNPFAERFDLAAQLPT